MTPGAIGQASGLMTRVAIFDGDEAFAKELSEYLNGYGCITNVFQDAVPLLDALQANGLDLVVLDVDHGPESRFEILRRIRTSSDVPCVIVTSGQDEVDRIVGLEIGADDYITKSTSLREILARIRAVVRRFNRQMASTPAEPPAKAEGWRLVLDKRELYRPDGSTVDLTTVEFEILVALAEAQGKAVKRNELCERVFHRPYRAGDRTVDMAIVKLRRKIELNPERPEVIKTVRPFGYVYVGFPRRSK